MTLWIQTGSMPVELAPQHARVIRAGYRGGVRACGCILFVALKGRMRYLYFALPDAFVLILSEVIIYHASSLMSTYPCAGLL